MHLRSYWPPCGADDAVWLTELYCSGGAAIVGVRIQHACEEKADSRENRHKDAFHGTHSKVQFCLLDLKGYRINQKMPHRTRRCKHAKRRPCR